MTDLNCQLLAVSLILMLLLFQLSTQCVSGT